LKNLNLVKRIVSRKRDPCRDRKSPPKSVNASIRRSDFFVTKYF